MVLGRPGAAPPPPLPNRVSGRKAVQSLADAAEVYFGRLISIPAVLRVGRTAEHTYSTRTVLECTPLQAAPLLLDARPLLLVLEEAEPELEPEPELAPLRLSSLAKRAAAVKREKVVMDALGGDYLVRKRAF